MKRANVFMYDKYAGMLTEDEDGFRFVYDSKYLHNPDAEAISLTIDNIAKKLRKALIKWIDMIDASFLPDDFKKQYKKLIIGRMLRLK